MNDQREEMKNALNDIDFPFDDPEKIISFLQLDQTDKDNQFRVFAWLIKLGLISNNKENAINTILEMFQQYNEFIDIYFNNSNDPFQDEESSLILLDVKRITDWFLRMAVPLKSDQNYIEDFQYHIRRILFFLPKLKDDPYLRNAWVSEYLKSVCCQTEYHYIQGFDRYASITYILSLDFIKKINDSVKFMLFPLEFAEMLSLYFTYLFISLSRILINIANSTQETMEFFEKFDQTIEKEIPYISNRLKSCLTSSIHFALRWVLLLFADEHDFENCLILWDHFVLHQYNITDYIIKVSISHLRQVPYDGVSYIDKIQNFKKWDVSKIIRESDNISYEYIDEFLLRGVVTKAAKLVGSYCCNQLLNFLKK